MTPTQIETAARNRYNAIGDSFWSSEEIFQLLYEACQEIAQECLTIERTYTTSTVISQQEYTYPTEVIAIKRITYNGQKLMPINFREDDAVTGLNAATAGTGTPQFWFLWNEVIYLRPVPDTVGTLKIFAFKEASPIVTSSTLEIPTLFHHRTINYILSRMVAKDQNFTASAAFMQLWQKDLLDIKRFIRKRKRTDGFAVVQNEENLVGSWLGSV